MLELKTLAAFAAVGGACDHTVLEGVELDLDLADGDQVVALPDGYVVQSAVIKKPATLSPENIAAGVDIAGVVGTHSGGTAGCATVTFMNGTTELLARPVYIGDDCPDPVTQGRIGTPTKESSAQSDFTYSGWTSVEGGAASATNLKNITADKVLYAAYTSSARKYTVTYYDTDASTVLHTEQVAYGTTPSYVPTKEGAAFSGWTPTPVPVTGDASYTVASWIEALASGSCGDTATWVLSGDGVLTVSGTGTVTAFIGDNNCSNQITEVVIEEGITRIDYNYAFHMCKEVVSISFPSTLTYLYSGVFQNFSKLTAVHIPSFDAWCSLEIKNEYSTPLYTGNATLYVNGAAVEGAVTIPNTVTAIGAYTFMSYKKITVLTIPASVTSIGICAFASATLSSVVFEDTEGWTAGTTALSSSDLANTTTADSYLTYTYRTKAWTKS